MARFLGLVQCLAHTRGPINGTMRASVCDSAQGGGLLVAGSGPGVCPHVAQPAQTLERRAPPYWPGICPATRRHGSTAESAGTCRGAELLIPSKPGSHSWDWYRASTGWGLRCSNQQHDVGKLVSLCALVSPAVKQGTRSTISNQCTCRFFN